MFDDYEPEEVDSDWEYEQYKDLLRFNKISIKPVYIASEDKIIVNRQSEVETALKAFSEAQNALFNAVVGDSHELDV